MTGIVLVGFMGTGKTAVGQALSRALHFPYMDTDDLIVAQAQKSITRIFSEDGEPAFREWETRILEQLAKGWMQPRVIATGGGIVLADRNWPWLRRLGRVICLQAEPETILQRVGTAPDRPLLAGTREEVSRRIQALLSSRAAAYAQADWHCVTDRRTPQEVADEIIRWCEAQAS
jgi:shikimate kinase